MSMIHHMLKNDRSDFLELRSYCVYSSRGIVWINHCRWIFREFLLPSRDASCVCCLCGFMMVHWYKPGWPACAHKIPRHPSRAERIHFLYFNLFAVRLLVSGAIIKQCPDAAKQRPDVEWGWALSIVTQGCVSIRLAGNRPRPIKRNSVQSPLETINT